MKILLFLLALPLLAQTTVKPDQIRNWEQVRAPGSTGTALAVDQLALDADARRVWKREAAAPANQRYRVAVRADGHAVLITCQGPGSCDEQYPLWFKGKK